jgi:hypothetical protein
MFIVASHSLIIDSSRKLVQSFGIDFIINLCLILLINISTSDVRETKIIQTESIGRHTCTESWRRAGMAHLGRQ